MSACCFTPWCKARRITKPAWTIFQNLVTSVGIRGSDTTDAYLAALAMEHDCEWWTTDRGFRRFPNLRWRNLIA